MKYLMVLVIVTACTSTKKPNQNSLKGSYSVEINLSDTNKTIHLGDTIVCSYSFPSEINTSLNEKIIAKQVFHQNSFIAARKEDTTIFFYGYNGFLFGNIDGTKDRSYFSWKVNTMYKDYFIAKDTGIYYFHFIAQLTNLSVVDEKDVVYNIKCNDKFNVSNTHREIVEQVNSGAVSTFNHYDTVGNGYYCFRVVP